MSLSDEDVREILRIIDESELDELRLETDGFVLHVLRGGSPTPAPTSPTPASASQAVPAPRAEPSTPHAALPDGTLTIPAPMLGTFYRAEGPGQEPFVVLGSRVDPDSTVGIIEVMKMMNSVPAGVAGTIVEICSQNAELVEYGEPLFRVKPTT